MKRKTMLVCLITVSLLLSLTGCKKEEEIPETQSQGSYSVNAGQDSNNERNSHIHENVAPNQENIEEDTEVETEETTEAPKVYYDEASHVFGFYDRDEKTIALFNDSTNEVIIRDSKRSIYFTGTYDDENITGTGTGTDQTVLPYEFRNDDDQVKITIGNHRYYLNRREISDLRDKDEEVFCAISGGVYTPPEYENISNIGELNADEELPMPTGFEDLKGSFEIEGCTLEIIPSPNENMINIRCHCDHSLLEDYRNLDVEGEFPYIISDNKLIVQDETDKVYFYIYESSNTVCLQVHIVDTGYHQYFINF